MVLTAYVVLSPATAIGFTHLENRLKNRDLDDRRFWKRLYYGPSPNVDKTRVFRTGRPLIKRCVHEIAGDRLSDSHIFEAQGKVAVVADGVLPKSPLPKPEVAIGPAPEMKPRLDQGAAEMPLDSPPAAGKICILC